MTTPRENCNDHPHQPRDEGDLMSENEIDVEGLRDRAEFWASRDPETGLYDKHAVAFAGEVVALVDEVKALRGQVERVRALVNLYDDGGNKHAYCIDPRNLRAALDGPR